ncbi:MAG: CHAT domain-containing protein [Acidobacteriia bacterium]|nr:CHAT domain-containing protein [Terriglobia bacterium]
MGPAVTESYLLKLNSGTVAELVLEQGPTDLLATIVSPSGDRVIVDERDSGPEPIFIEARVDGIYRLEVSAQSKLPNATPYSLTVGEFRPRKEDDDLRLQAQQLSTDAKRHESGKTEERKEALALCSRARDLWHQLGDRRAEASTLVRMGAYSFRLGEVTESRTRFVQALELAQSEGARWTEGEALSNLGLILWQSGEFSGALERWNQAQAVWKDLGHRYGEAAVLNNLGLRYRAIGSYQQAYKSYKQSLALLAALGDHVHEAPIWSNLGVLQRALAEDSTALQSFRRAAAQYHAAGDSRGEGRAILHMAEIYAAAHRSRQARRSLDQALPLAQAARDHRSVGDCFKLLGELLASGGAKQEALKHYDNALAVYRGISNSTGEAGALHSIGVLQGEMGNTTAALDYLNQALAIRHALGVRDEEAETLFQLARIERESGKLQEARTHIDATLDLAESVRALVAGAQLRMSYMASKNKYYAFACDLYRQMDHENPGGDFARLGFSVAERGRARSLLDLVAEGQIGIGETASKDLVARERRMHESLNALSQDVADLSEKSDRQKLEAATHRLDQALDEYYQLESEIRDADPRYARISPRPLGAAEIQSRLLDRQTVLLEYALGDQHSSVWLLTPESVTLFTLPGRAGIERAVSRFFQSLERSDRGSKGASAQADLQKAAAALSRMILPPAPALWGKRILIVGDGVLQRVPFGALPGPGRAASLIEDHEIVLLPSASVVASERSETATRKAPVGTLAVIADPVFDAGDARTDKPASGVKPVFARLPFSRREADEILQLAPAQSALRAVDFSAERSLFTSGRLAQYRIVHIATHAVVDAARPDLSALVFSMVDHQGAPRNGYLRLHEITSLHLPAKLVTLSACGTGLGKEVRGEGTVGLARGFIHGGAATVVVSLWDVEDESTAELMKLFYAGLLGPRHLAPPAALREAQHAMLKSGKWSPYQWSGWLAIGEWR